MHADTEPRVALEQFARDNSMGLGSNVRASTELITEWTQALDRVSMTGRGTVEFWLRRAARKPWGQRPGSSQQRALWPWHLHISPARVGRFDLMPATETTPTALQMLHECAKASGSERDGVIVAGF